MTTTFHTLYAFAQSNQSKTAKTAPAKLSRKFDDQTVTQVLPVDPATLTTPEDVVAAAALSECKVSFATPMGAAKATKPFTLTTEASGLFAAELIGVDAGASLESKLAGRAANVEVNGVHA